MKPVVHAILTLSLLSATSLRADDAETAKADQAKAEQIKHGSYLVHRVAMCVQCHSPRDDQGALVRNQLLKGASMPVQSPFRYQVWAFLAPPLAGLPSGYSEDDLINLLTQGKKLDGTTPRHPMPPFRLTDADARAVTAYLSSLKSSKDMSDISYTPSAAPERAMAVVRTAEDQKPLGVVTFTLEDGVMHIKADLFGLTPGLHGFHIHETGDCSAPHDKSMGGHFNPEGKPHGSPDGAESHIGDLGNIVADEVGRAHYERYDHRLTFEGDHSIVGRAVIIHEKMDDLTTQPSGDAGTPIACGSIEKIK